ncbi:hypothetical protein PCH_Pc12g06010 [Penicillium rubens Wisconsin 54-1255]|uniref:Uncharacterized protein n=1 Tax=Penicillium rubens (strain ATCC 28089 / DSM 1075 / NRRL 1951 / Wisconsin 54-1255) TaxID=500485 RepID=B6GZX4_PENRW|nr:hypothetical protein PCH_Pc12g06010 [Penicillium rubens Wisconsin 54-1255]
MSNYIPQNSIAQFPLNINHASTSEHLTSGAQPWSPGLSQVICVGAPGHLLSPRKSISRFSYPKLNPPLSLSRMLLLHRIHAISVCDHEPAGKFMRPIGVVHC